MSFRGPSGNIIDLCLLDTNIISEIVKNHNQQYSQFIDSFYENPIAFCISPYSLIEIRRRQDIYDQFIHFFSKIPCLITKSFDKIFSDEKLAYGDSEKPLPIGVALSPSYENTNYHLENFINELFLGSDVQQTERNWRDEELSILNVWEGQRNNFEQITPANAIGAEKYKKEAGIQTLISLEKLFGSDWLIKRIGQGSTIDVNEFPSIVVMLYSQYYRLYDPQWKREPQEITDIRIISAAPYMDIIITEKFQAEILRKIKRNIKIMSEATILTLSDIRNSTNEHK